MCSQCTDKYCKWGCVKRNFAFSKGQQCGDQRYHPLHTSDGKYRKNLASILLILLLQSIDTIDIAITFPCFLKCNVTIRNCGRTDNLFYAEENLIKLNHVHWKHFLVFSGSSIRADYKYACELAMATSEIWFA